MRIKVSFASAAAGSVLSKIDLVLPGDTAIRSFQSILVRFGAQVVMSEVCPSDEGFHQRLHLCSLDGGILGRQQLVRIAAEIALVLSGQQPVKRAIPRKGVAAA